MCNCKECDKAKVKMIETLSENDAKELKILCDLVKPFFVLISQDYENKLYQVSIAYKENEQFRPITKMHKGLNQIETTRAACEELFEKLKDIPSWKN